MLKKLGAAAAIAAFMATSAIAEEAKTLRVGMSGGYFPFTFVQKGKLQGFEVDVMNAVGKEAGLEIEFETMSFSGLIGALDVGRIDTIANQITITPEREEKFEFSQAYVIDGAQVVVKRGNDTINGVEDLQGKSVAVNLGSNFEELLKELPYADEIDIRTYESNIAQDVALGRVDAFVMDRVSSAQLIKESPLPLELSGKPFSELRNALPFARTGQGKKFHDKVDAALTTLRDNGTLTEISMKWFGTDITRLEE